MAVLRPPYRGEGGRDYAATAVLMLGAMLVRLPLLLTPGHDVRDYRDWARVVDPVGIGGAYSAAYPSSPRFNYPPLYTTLRPGGG